jgi:hypothetical protein
VKEDTVRYAIRASIRNAVALGRDAERKKTFVKPVEVTAFDYAEGLIIPAVEAAVAEATARAIWKACEPWSMADDCGKTPAPVAASPLVWVWMGGAYATMAAAAEMLGLKIDWDSGISYAGADTLEELVRAELDSLLDGAGVARPQVAEAS